METTHNHRQHLQHNLQHQSNLPRNHQQLSNSDCRNSVDNNNSNKINSRNNQPTENSQRSTCSTDTGSSNQTPAPVSSSNTGPAQSRAMHAFQGHGAGSMSGYFSYPYYTTMNGAGLVMANCFTANGTAGAANGSDNASSASLNDKVSSSNLAAMASAAAGNIAIMNETYLQQKYTAAGIAFDHVATNAGSHPLQQAIEQGTYYYPWPKMEPMVPSQHLSSSAESDRFHQNTNLATAAAMVYHRAAVSCVGGRDGATGEMHNIPHASMLAVNPQAYYFQRQSSIGARECVKCGTLSTTAWCRDDAGYFLCTHCASIDQYMQHHPINSVYPSPIDHRATVVAQNQARRMNNQQHICANCGTTETTLWRRDSSGQSVCNACGLYFKLHKVNRPMTMRKDGIQTRKRKAGKASGKSKEHRPAKIAKMSARLPRGMDFAPMQAAFMNGHHRFVDVASGAYRPVNMDIDKSSCDYQNTGQPQHQQQQQEQQRNSVNTRLALGSATSYVASQQYAAMNATSQLSIPMHQQQQHELYQMSSSYYNEHLPAQENTSSANNSQNNINNCNSTAHPLDRVQQQSVVQQSRRPSVTACDRSHQRPIDYRAATASVSLQPTLIHEPQSATTPAGACGSHRPEWQHQHSSM